MPRVICLAILLITAGWTFAQSRKGTAATQRQNALVQLAQRRFAAFFEGDKTAYEQLVAKDAVFAYSNGRTLNYVEAVSELAPLAKAGTYSFHYEDVKFRDFGDSALLPKSPEIRFHAIITVALGEHGLISHVINDTGEATAIRPRVTPKVTNFP
jgi:Domain of unknown function (DUF4440)